MENKQTKLVRNIIGGVLVTAFFMAVLSFPWTGFEAKVFWKACSLDECLKWRSAVQEFKTTLTERKDANTNGLARADLFIDNFYKKQEKYPENYLIPLKQYARLITRYKNQKQTRESLDEFRRDYNKFSSCHKHMKSYYKDHGDEQDLAKLDYYLFDGPTQFQNIHNGFMAQKDLGDHDLSDFQSAVLIRERCFMTIDDVVAIQRFIATKGNSLELDLIQKDIIKFEARFGTKYRERYKNLIYLATRQYVDQTLNP